MIRIITSTAIALAFLVAPAIAQDATIGSLLADGYEIKGVASADLATGQGQKTAQSVFVVLQKDTTAYGCILQSINSSFCQRMQ